MKILGTVKSDTFLAEITTAEIDFLSGKKIGEDVSSGYYNMTRRIYSGTEFNIGAAITQIHYDQARKDNIARARQTLELILKTLEMAESFIVEPKPEDTKAE